MSLRTRAAVVLRDDDRRVALIRRVRDGRTYFVFPGGGIEPGETPADAAVREAHEELGVRVILGPRLLIEETNGHTVHYFSASIVGGEFGTGTGADMSDGDTHEPLWMAVADLPHYRVYPRALAAILTSG